MQTFNSISCLPSENCQQYTPESQRLPFSPCRASLVHVKQELEQIRPPSNPVHIFLPPLNLNAMKAEAESQLHKAIVSCYLADGRVPFQQIFPSKTMHSSKVSVSYGGKREQNCDATSKKLLHSARPTSQMICHSCIQRRLGDFLPRDY